ncbi:transporter substrate-binding domain-containing protein [Pseudodesulfovibrio sp. zrk46]|uniref:substrate-binding periplasmic protein n=1 Tax=Pseudodesulfovibrio sp. zrk46 TaxID=2725288 RepID=UPI001449B382|nr:transporter substrate-binding domain-containing protein [Pseudodesulfovibrio sp. zrk46]QJB58090.1 transporter substrate-binding domain-containing protein [Pseudodesulfovibrio sp. zrk46]
MTFFTRFLFFLIISLLFTLPCQAGKYVALTAPMPPFSINKGLRVKGIAVDILSVLMAQSGAPIDTKDVKLMLWRHALQIGAAGPQKIVLNLERTPDNEHNFKWVGPIATREYVVVARKGSPHLNSLNDLGKNKVGTLRDSLPEKELLAQGIPRTAMSSSFSHIVPLKKLKSKMVSYFAHGTASTAYLMKSAGLKWKDYEVVLTFNEVPIYFGFSKDTPDAFINKMNTNLAKLKRPGAGGRSGYEKIVAKYLPPEVVK